MIALLDKFNFVTFRITDLERSVSILVRRDGTRHCDFMGAKILTQGFSI
jgi:hypothetical protein